MTRRAVALLAAAALLACACGSRAADVAPAVSASASPTASSTPAATSTPTATAPPSAVAFPDLPFIVGTNGGDLYFQLVNGQPAGRKVHVCDSSVQNLVAYGRQALFRCGAGADSTLYLYDDATASIAAIAKTEISTYALTDTGQAVYVTMGKTEPAAPIAMTRLMVLDLRTGASTQIDERYGVAFELRLTGEGLMVWRPKNSLSFVRSDADAGTWFLRGTTLTKLSQYRLIDGGKGRDLLESEAVDPGTGFSSSGLCCTYVVSKTTTEQRLTPPDVRNEKGLALLEDGRLVTWRPENGEYDGSVVIYDAGRVERSDRGRFSSYAIHRSGDWLVTQEAAPTPALHAYRSSDGAFAATPVSGFSALAILGPKK